MKNRKNSLTKNLAIALLLVAVMFLGVATIPAPTFAASEPVEEPYYGEVYASTATYNSADYSLDARDVIDDLTHDSTWGAWNSNKKDVLHDIDDAAKIINVIKDNATFSGMYASEHIPEEYDLLIATPTQSVYITFPLDEVTVNTRGAGLVYKLPVEATGDIMDIYAMSRGVDLKPKEPIVTEDCGPGVAIYDSNWKCIDTSVEDTRRIATIINDAYVYSHVSDIYVPDEFDVVIIDNYFSQVIYMIDNQLLVVIDGGSYAYVCTIDFDTRSDIMAILGRTTAPTIKLTAEIIENLKEISKSNPKLNVAGLDIALVERFIFEADQQAALEIVNILQANGHANDQYLQDALFAKNYMDMSSSLMMEIISICEDHIYMVDYSTYGYLVGEVQDYYQNGQKPQAVVERAYHAMCVAIWMKSLTPVYWLES